MTERKVLIPGDNHPIDIKACPSMVIIRSGTDIIPNTSHGLTLSETSYPPVHYIPRADVLMAMLERSAYTTYCPYKGTAYYYHITALAGAGLNKVWTYEDAFEAVHDITGYLAFYPDAVSIELIE